MDKKIYLIILPIILLAFFLFSFLSKTPFKSIDLNPKLEKKYAYNHKISIKNQNLMVEIADSPEKMTKGLSGRENLAEENAMLFIYPTPTETSFWMPDMNFPIDIIFIKNNQIVKIYSNVPNYPPDYPKEKLPLYRSEEPIDMVLETVSGWSDKNNLKLGDLVTLN